MIDDVYMVVVVLFLHRDVKKKYVYVLRTLLRLILILKDIERTRSLMIIWYYCMFYRV